jgi:shikimate kinase
VNHVFLIGFMCSGKSAVGRDLARRLGRPFVDLDDRVEKAAGRSIPELFESEGEAAFRAMERQALLAVASEPSSVVACGGGIVTDEANRAELRQLGTTVWLRVSAERALDRAGGSSGRPLMDGRDEGEIRDLAAIREPMYLDAADIEVDTDEMDVAAIASAIEVALSGAAT